jgi:hypothetical protein
MRGKAAQAVGLDITELHAFGLKPIKITSFYI